jgi:hypothetical protein
MIHAKHLVIYWHSKGLKAEAINAKLKDYFGVTVPPYLTVPYWCRKLKLKYNSLVIRRGLKQLPEVDLENAILDSLTEFHFHTGGSISSGPKTREGESRNVFLKYVFTHDSTLH